MGAERGRGDEHVVVNDGSHFINKEMGRKKEKIGKLLLKAEERRRENMGEAKKTGARRAQQVPCWQRRGSESSAAEHFDKSCSSGRMWTEVVFHWDEQDVI